MKRKRMQADINALVLDAINNLEFDGEQKFVDRLRSSNAIVWETKHWYFLQSYATFVAAINKETGPCMISCDMTMVTRQHLHSILPSLPPTTTSHSDTHTALNGRRVG